MKQYNRYQFKSGSRLVKGEKPDFFDLLVRQMNQKYVVLDLGCGSGELALKLAPYCRKIVGIDSYSRYIATAKKDCKVKKCQNVSFKVCDAKKLPFRRASFDFIYSSRGPLSASADFLREAERVLKPGGFMAEETIGETDKLEIKKVFKRGQNFPYTVKKKTLVRRLLSEFGLKPIYGKDFVYYQKFPSLVSIVRVLTRTPIIPDFDRRRDNNNLQALKKSLSGRLILSAHRLWWMAQKKNTTNTTKICEKTPKIVR